jgi:malate permease and related proteins
MRPILSTPRHLLCSFMFLSFFSTVLAHSLEFSLELLPLYCLIAVGFMAGRILKVGPDDLAKIIVYVLSPLAQFDVFYRHAFTVDLIALPFGTLLFCSAMCGSAYWLGGRLFDPSTRALFGYASGIGNSLNFGLPVCLALIPGASQDIVDAVILYTLGTMFYNHTVGGYVAARGAFSPRESLVKLLKIPVLYACTLGAFFQMFSIPVSKRFLELADYSKGGLVVIGLLLVGISYATLPDLKSMRKALDKTFVMSFLVVKFVAWPILSFLLILLDQYSFMIFTPTQRSVILIIGFCPAAVSVVIYSTLFKVEPAKAAVLVAISTAVAAFLVPLVGAVFFSM